MIRVRLRRVVQGDFRKSDATQLDDLRRKERHLVDSLRGEDAILFINHGRNQLMFVHGFKQIEGKQLGIRRTVIFSQKLRMLDGSWNPYMLGNYATQVGLELVGIKFFQDHFRKLHTR